jgi:hypothetical protein
MSEKKPKSKSKGKPKVRLLTEDQKRNKGLIKTNKNELARHFNYHYMFI